MMATILDSLLGSCAKKLQEIITDEAILILGVEEELAKLQGRIPLIQSCLVDAERRRTEEPAVNIWLGQLRDAMYDVDVITDLARFKGSKLLPDHPSSSSSKSAACSVLSLSSCFSNIGTRHEVAVKIRSLNKKIENISKDMMFFKFVSTQPAVAGQRSTSKQRKSGNLVEPNLVGKETLRACTRLVEQVLAHKEKKDYKLGIVGTGGVGKTTLAQKIYNDQKIKGSFSSQAWICVSQEYSQVALMKEILRNIGVHHEQDETIGELSSKLEAAIRDKSFFLVLDDVWQHDVWTSLLRVPLHAATTGIIVVTTRHDTVAHEDVHRVDLMPADVGWELLWKSMNIDEEKDVQHLRDIGKDIVRKCGGLPLAIKVTSSVLATKEKTENEWRKFIDRNAWSMGNLPTELRGALYLSYDDLPYILKQCFLYCATFPEDHVLVRDDLVTLWVAEGFVEEQQGQLLEDTTEEYYYELIHRNLLQLNPSFFDHTRCKMHDLVRQLACYLSREECFVGDPESLGGINILKYRRITAVKKDMLVLPSMDKQEVKVRTFQTDQRLQRVDDSIFKRFPYLRVLQLSDSFLQSIPGCIGNLIHLRLLDLDGTTIPCLPESISSLINLQILNLQRCKHLQSLPLALTRLCNLRRLGLRDTPIDQVPKGIGRLKLLNDVEGFPIGGGTDNNGKTQDGWKLEELEHLSQLRRLVVVRLERAVPSSTHSLLIDKEYLKVLGLFCSGQADEPCSEEDISNIERIFEQLIPPQNLEHLVIYGFFGKRFPTWHGATHLSSVKYLELIDCKSRVHLPPIGQLPNLRYLEINGATTVTRIGPEFLGCGGDNPRSTDAVAAFPKLEELVIRDMPNWEEWCFVEDEDAATAVAGTEGGEDGSAEIQKGEVSSPRMRLLPCLKELYLRSCPKLRALPRQLGQEASSLKVLHIRGASCLKAVEDLPFLSEMLLISGCEGLERVSNLPQVRDLRVSDCPELRRVEGLGGLQQLWLDEGMQEISSLWVPGLQEHAQDLDVYTWPRS